MHYKTESRQSIELHGQCGPTLSDKQALITGAIDYPVFSVLDRGRVKIVLSRTNFLQGLNSNLVICPN